MSGYPEVVPPREAVHPHTVISTMKHAGEIKIVSEFDPYIHENICFFGLLDNVKREVDLFCEEFQQPILKKMVG